MIVSVAKRLAEAATTILIAIAISFVLGRIAGDPVRQVLGELATAEQVAAKRAELGLDRPLVVQFFRYVGGLLTGDLGTSLRYNRPNGELIMSRLPSSLLLVSAALVLGLIAGLLLGIVAAARENSIWDRLAVSVSLVGQSIPLYWLGMVLVLVFSLNLKWLPAGQSGSLRHLVLPAVTLAMWPLARVARLTRSAVGDVLHEQYVLAAVGRGVPRRRVLAVHVLRNAALPIVTLIGLQAGALLSGAVTVEFIFAWPGIGTLATEAVRFRDFALMQSIVVVGAVSFVLINLVLEGLYGLIDPRVRTNRGRR